MQKMLIGLLCGLALHTPSAQARLLANERTAYIQSFLSNCHAAQIRAPANQNLISKGQLTSSQIDAFCQCGAIRSADTLDSRILEEFGKNQNRQPLLGIIDQVTRYCSETQRLKP
jgi:hypothetical protein